MLAISGEKVLVATNVQFVLIFLFIQFDWVFILKTGAKLKVLIVR